MGVSGSGKTTVGVRLAEALGAEFIDGDDLHTDAARAKMKSGHAADRRRPLALARPHRGDARARASATVVACSALRRAYRDRLRAAAGPKLRFVYLEATLRKCARASRAASAITCRPRWSTASSPRWSRRRDEPDVIAISAHADLDAEIPRLAERLRGGRECGR